MSIPIVLLSIPAGWPADAPPRSAFFGVAPAGCSGEGYEDLASYFRRLSVLHRISPRPLAVRAVKPLLREQNVLTLQNSYCNTAMNGVSQIAAAWISALNRLTLRNDLALRTLLPLKAFVPRFKLISRNERFCPACYRDDELANRQKYNRLLWSIDCVEACPIHKVALEPILKQGALLPFRPPGLDSTRKNSLY